MSKIPSQYSKVYDLSKTNSLNSSIIVPKEKRNLLQFTFDGKIFLSLQFKISATITGGDILISLSSISEMTNLVANDSPILLFGRDTSTGAIESFICSFNNSTQTIVFSDVPTADEMPITNEYFLQGTLVDNDMSSSTIHIWGA